MGVTYKAVGLTRKQAIIKMLEPVNKRVSFKYPGREIGGLTMNTCLASAIVLSTISAFAAQNAPDQPKFEVASVKRTDRCEFNTSFDPGSITLKGVPLKAVLMEAFRVTSDQIEGPS